MSFFQRLARIVNMLQRVVKHHHIEESVLIAGLEEVAQPDVETMLAPGIVHRNRAEIHAIGVPALLAQIGQQLSGPTPDIENPSLALKGNTLSSGNLTVQVFRIQQDATQ